MVVVVQCLLMTLFILANSAPVEKKSSAMTDTLSAIQRLVNYYKSTYRELNIDGLFGLRVLEGQLGIILDEYGSGKLNTMTEDVVKRISSLKQEATSLSEAAVKFVKKSDEDYYKNLHFVVGRPWTIWKKHRRLNLTTHWDRKVYLLNKVKLTEAASDRCMTQLTGSLDTNSAAKCQISSDCIDLMTSKGLTGYGITHQILWTMLGEQAGCLDALRVLFMKRGLGSVEDVQNEFCTNGFFEMIETVNIVLKGDIKPKFQDLFLEQQFICPNIGFYQYLSVDYLYDMMSWQKPSGCYGSMPRRKEGSMLPSDLDYYDETISKNSSENKFKYAKNIDRHSDGVIVQKGQKLVEQFPNPNVLKNPSDNDNPIRFKQRNLLMTYDNTGHHGRKLLAEKELSGGCLAHKTGVAAGALVMYLHYLLNPGPSDIFYSSDFVKSALQGLEPLSYSEDIAYALSLGETLENVKEKTNLKFVPHGKPKQATNSTTKKIPARILLKEPSAHADKEYDMKNNALNNNVLAQQLHAQNKKDNDYYSDPKMKDNYYANGKQEAVGDYPRRNHGSLNSNHRMVRIDSGKQNKDDYMDEDYKEDDKADDYNEKEEEKNDDRDYPYYDNNKRKEHDDYVNEKEERLSNHQEEGANKAVEDSALYKLPRESDGTNQSRAVLSISVICIVVLFIFMYRFIRTRRVYIRYSIRSLMRL